MLEEFLYYLGCRCRPSARRLGYAYEMAALQARHRRCRQHWQPHLDATRQSLLIAAANLPTRGDAVIVGGGCLQDIPIVELLDYCERIYLLDVVFTWPTRRMAKRYPGRIHCCHFDVAGIIERLVQNPNRLSLDQMLAAWPSWPVEPVWIASVNVVHQLPLLPIRWLSRRGVKSEDLASFGDTLIEAHLQQLLASEAAICLITEVETRRYDRQGTAIALTDYRPALQSFQRNASLLSQWLWPLNPSGELPAGEVEISTVEAWCRPGLSITASAPDATRT